MKIIFFLVTSTAFLGNALAQNFSSISGKIIDAKTKETLPGATVFLANTAIGVFANETGAFMLTKIPRGKYDLTVSMVGYASYAKPILFSGNTLEDLVVSLEPALVQLDAVTVKARREKQDRHYYSQFEKRFLGLTQNSRHCKILNPFDIFVYKDGDKIIALASKPIIIENKALGYKVYYELKEFEIRKVIHGFSMSGIPRFEELTPESEKQKQKWIKERDRAYFGSISHFLISLLTNKLDSNYFKIRGAGGNFFTKQEIMKDSSIRYKGSLQVTFDGEYPEYRYSGYMIGYYQYSEIKFSGDPITVYRNGYFEDYRNLIFQGYMGWSVNIAEMVPFGYQPTDTFEKKMIAVIQRVAEASVTIDGKVKSQIQKGLLVLLGIEDADNSEDIDWLANKIVNLRIFNDAEGVMNVSVKDEGGDIIVVSQFTLHASTKKGNRPSYIKASKPEIAIPLYEKFVKVISEALGKPVQTGSFGADMKVSLLNDGPVTIVIDTKNKV